MQNLLSAWTVKGGLYSVYTSKPLGFSALEDVAEAAAVILMEGPEKHSGKDYWFSADVLDPQQVAETLTAATGHKFTAAVRDPERFLKKWRCRLVQRSKPAYAKGGNELFRQVEERKNGVHWKRSRRYKDTSRSRAIVAAGLGKVARQ